MISTTLTLRPFTRDDVPAAALIEAEVYAQPWSERVFLDELDQPSRAYLAAEVDGDLMGYGGVMLVGDAPPFEAHITTVVVAPGRRGGRIGTRLMLGLVEQALAGEAGSLTLEVRASNAAAQSLYRRFGMAPVGVRKNYYRDEDALIMWVHDLGGAEFSERLASVREGIAGEP